MTRKELKNIIKDAILQIEITTTGTTAGSEEFNTPGAFKKKNPVLRKDMKKKKKEKRYYDPLLVKEEINEQDWAKLKKIIRMEIASIYFDLYKKRTTWM